jgi:hypothetical protein
MIIAVLYDNNRPRYLPHLDHPEVLQMGLSPLGAAGWIETDNHIGAYHRHKLQQRHRLGDRVYRATAGSLDAQRELADLLLTHLSVDQDPLYRVANAHLHCLPGKFSTELESAEPLWNCSLWLADDLVLMEQQRGEYRLTAASLCSPSHWRLEDKFDRPLREIHDPIPHFHQALTPRIDRFFKHLKAEHPVVRTNWALQANDQLNPVDSDECPVSAATSLYYRSERQSLVRLPLSGAVAFTIRVYLHPLAQLAAVPGALPALFAAIDQTPPELAHYKCFDRLAPALAPWRDVKPDHAYTASEQ